MKFFRLLHELNSKTKGFLLIAVLCLLVMAASAGGIHKVRSVEGFLEGTTLDGEDVSGQPVQGIVSRVNDKLINAQVELTEDGTTVLKGSLKDFGRDFDEQAFTDDLLEEEEHQKNDLGTTVQRLTKNVDFQLTDYYEDDNEQLEKFVVSSNFLVPRVKSADACIQMNEEKGLYEVVSAVEGNEIDDQKLQEYVEKSLDDAILSGRFKENPVLTLSIPQDVYLNIEVSPETEEMKKEVQEKNTQLIKDTFANVSITYTFGSETEVLGGEQITEWLKISEDFEIEVDEDKVTEYVSGLADKYDTRGRDRAFVADDGRIIHIPPETNQYGYTIYQEVEVQQLISDILGREPVTREPVYESVDSYGCPVFGGREGKDDLMGTYVEVSIPRQHLWFYKDGTLIVEGDVVTGDDGSDETRTKTGCYPLGSKHSPATLKGANSVDYWSSEVDYWMPFNEDQGLHDAPWRSEFGGEIYKGDGSHGCVNLSFELANAIYENITPGTAVIVY